MRSLSILLILLTGSVTWTSAQVDLNAGLVAHYPLDGNANDISGNGYHGVASNTSSTNDRWGVANQALAFSSGLPSKITITSNTDFESASFSINLWSLSNIVVNDGLVIRREAHYFIQKIVDVNKPAFLFSFVDTNLDITQVSFTRDPTILAVMITLTYDEPTKTVRIYHNGKLLITEILPASINVNSNDIVIGDAYDGNLDEIRFYNRVLNQEEIDLLYEDIIFPDFSFPAPVFAGDEVSFTDQSTSDLTITSWQWDFEDNASVDATTQNASYTFQEVGFFDVKLTISDGTNTRTIVIDQSVTAQEPTPPALIDQAEYFFDSDPGVGSGTSITINTPAEEVDLNFSADATGLLAGFHKLFIRFKEDVGAWSLYEGRIFFVHSSSSVAPATQISSAEYFYDTDPGIGLGTAISLSATTAEINEQFSTDATGLTAGFHKLFVRVQDDKGLWSLSEGRIFYIQSLSVSATGAPINAYEYFIGSDPGVGSGTIVNVASTQQLDAIILIDLNGQGLTDGDYTLSIRVKDENNIWSLHETRDFTICSSGQTYYADTDADGFGDIDNSLFACSQPAGYVTNSDDCDDTDINITDQGITWYLDDDGDGYGDSGTTTLACLQPVGYVSNADDCDDTDININPDTIWYADSDGDGFGNPGSTTTACVQPAGFVADNTDCNDGDININPDTVWYLDSDGDGFGDIAITQQSCTQPGGYVANSNDCDDGDSGIGAGQTWYADTDGDGFGDAATTETGCTQPAGFVADNTDCDDTDAAVNPDVIWYADTDGDGFGDAAATTTGCTQPTGFVADNTDCNDTDSAINPETIWYADTDVDGYGDPANSQTSCTQLAGFVANNLDCDDTNASVNPDVIWYADTDGDGFGDLTNTTTACLQPGGFVANADDCNDGDSLLNPDTIWYLDSDGDGFGDIAITQQSCTQPGGYVANSNDCDDGDSSIGAGQTWYADTDGDSFGDPTNSQTSCTQPAGFIADNTDCDDTDAAVNPDVIWYADTDSDGFGDAAATTTGCTQPTGFVADNTDCNDTDNAINPNVVWYADTDGDGFGDAASTTTGCTQPTGFVADNTDCNDTDTAVNPEVVWYADTDGDGFGDAASTTTSCVQPANFVANSNDCDDNDTAVNPEVTWYADADGDGHGDAVSTVASCTQPAGFVATSDDCLDTDADVYPGAPALPDGKDNDCDGTVDKITQTITFAALVDVSDGSGTIALTASTSSLLAVTYTVGGPATVDGTTLTLTGAGSVTVTAGQTGNEGYLPAADVTQSFCVNPVPEISVTGEGDVAMELASNYAAGNQWFSGADPIAGETNTTFTVPAGGTYKVVVTIDGCVGESVPIEALLTGLGLLSGAGELTIYPNPVDNTLIIGTGNLPAGQYTLRIVDMAGKMYISRKLTAGTALQRHEVDVNTLDRGNYLVILHNGDNVYVQKIVKQ